MVTINSYLNFQGNTEEAFNFYKSVLGGEFAVLQRFKDTPFCDNIPENERDGIMHIALPLGNGMLMGTDALESMGQKLVFGDNFNLAIEAESNEDADRIFNGLVADGKVTMPMEQMFWGAYFGALTDKFNVKWMVSHTPSK